MLEQGNKGLLSLMLTTYLVLPHGPALAQDDAAARQITFGNGERNLIDVVGLERGNDESPFVEERSNGESVVKRRGNSTVVSFANVVIEKPGWLVLHPVMDGRPNGKVVSGYAYLRAGANANTSIRIDHPAASGDKFLVMLHSDVNEDGVFDFVFVEDGVNVEDQAVFEGSRMIAHIISVP
ncbi:MAG: hypothetical protein AAGI72_15700 [Pseudomonadota bacterium]